MSVTLKDGGATATTGGTDQTFDRTNLPVNNGYEYADVSEDDFFARQKVIITTRQPQLQSDGSWSKQKTSCRVVIPKVLSDGSVSYNVGRVETEIHPESTAAELDELREFTAQMAIGAQFDNVFTAGTLPS